ncbi:glutamate 5-kinase [Halovenus salina]|uniref:Glutamate 5-kinase n=1 Tax=Halovenus salina TaxID=1510225 RepID=A0ABD5W525_9EURY|nr:glutamate 5-kinase [Halovenus salina]
MSDRVDAEAIDRARRQAAAAERVVVKIGTSSVTDEESNLDDDKLDQFVDGVNSLIDRGKEVIVVSSGAIGAGKGRIDPDGDTIEASQALSTIGQSHLMRRYTESFERYDRSVAQLLLTRHDLNNAERFTNFRNTLETLLEWDVVPIMNENDAVAIEELRIGDNDMLSASVGVGIDVDLLVTLTDVGGVYTDNPKEDDEPERIEAIGRNYAEIETFIEESTTDEFGGIRTKVRGARKISEHGAPAIIARSTEPDVLQKIATGEPVGTIFVPISEQQ